MTATAYLQIFDDWFTACETSAAADIEGSANAAAKIATLRPSWAAVVASGLVPESGEPGEFCEALTGVVRRVSRPLYLAIVKSSYLARRIYGGEAHRTERCPVHLGVWSGIPGPDDENRCACEMTGWLPLR